MTNSREHHPRQTHRLFLLSDLSHLALYVECLLESSLPREVLLRADFNYCPSSDFHQPPAQYLLSACQNNA